MLKTNGKNRMPCFAGRRAHHAGDEFVAHLGQRLHAARHAGAAARRRSPRSGSSARPRAACKGRNWSARSRVPRYGSGRPDEWRIARSDGSPVPIRSPLRLILVVVRAVRAPRRKVRARASVGSACRPERRTPLSAASARDKGESAAGPPPLGEVRRITFQTPAATPRKKNTISRKGFVPSRRSSAQPRPAPTMMAEMNSLPARMASDMPESPFGADGASADVGSPPGGRRALWRARPEVSRGVRRRLPP